MDVLGIDMAKSLVIRPSHVLNEHGKPMAGMVGVIMDKAIRLYRENRNSRQPSRLEATLDFWWLEPTKRVFSRIFK